MIAQLKIGSVLFPVNTKTLSYEIEVRTRAYTFEAEDRRVYPVSLPLECVINASVLCPEDKQLKADLIAFYLANRYSLFDVVDPAGYPLTDCRFRGEDKIRFKAVAIAEDHWEISFSLTYEGFTADSNTDLTPYSDYFTWKGGDEELDLRVSEGRSTTDSGKLWVLSDPITSRDYSFEFVDKKEGGFLWEVAQYYAAKFYDTITIDGLTTPAQPDGFEGLFVGNNFNLTWSATDVWSGSTLNIRKFD